MKRFCVECKKVFGCVKDGIELECSKCLNTCDKEIGGEHPTGGLCPNCFKEWRKDFEERKRLKREAQNGYTTMPSM